MNNKEYLKLKERLTYDLIKDPNRIDRFLKLEKQQKENNNFTTFQLGTLSGTILFLVTKSFNLERWTYLVGFIILILIYYLYYKESKEVDNAYDF